MSENNDIEIELDDEYYIDKCINGDTWDNERANACQILAMKCYDEIKELSPNEKKYLRKNIINEAKFEVTESEKDIINVEGGVPSKIWGRSNTIFDEGYDTKNFVDSLKEKRFGKCSIALYGIETQFWSQINEGLFQNKDNATALENIEGLILNNHSHYTFNNKSIIIAQLNEWKKEIGKDLPYTEESRVIYISRINKKLKAVFGDKKYEDLKFLNGFEYYEDKDAQKLYNYLISEGEIIPKNYYIYSGDDLTKHRICNDIHNPYINKGEYKFCSFALTNGKGQTFEIWKRRKETEASTAIHWDIADSLGCWHNFLDTMDKAAYPDYIRGRQKEVEIAYSLGEITEEQATQLLRDIRKLEEEFEESIKKLDKPVLYQPTRMRIYGSQLALQNLLNDALCRISLDEVQVDEVTKGKIRSAFSGINAKQLIEQKLYTDEEIQEMIEDFERLDLGDILVGMAETESAQMQAGENLMDYIAENIGARPQHIFDKDDFDALELIFEDVSDFINDEKYVNFDYTSPDEYPDVSEEEKKGKKPIIFYEEVQMDEIEIQTSDPSQWKSYATEAFPAIEFERIEDIFYKETDRYHYIQAEANVYGWYDLNNVAIAAENAMDAYEDILFDKIVDFITVDVRLEDIKPSVEQVYADILNDVSEKLGYGTYSELIGLAKNIVIIRDFINDKYSFKEKKYDNISADDLLMKYLHNAADDIKDEARNRLA